MHKKILAMLIAVSIMFSGISVFAETTEILLSEGFASYAENDTNITSVAVLSGVDTRVITDEGNKVLYSRALGEGVLVKANLDFCDCTQSVFSIRVKLRGNTTVGKLFNASYANGKQGFITLHEDRTLRLTDGKIVGSIADNRYSSVTLSVNWSRGIYSVYIDKKCTAANWYLPDGVRSMPKSLEWLFEYNEAGETEVFIDDIRIYEGSKLPWERSFPSEPSNSEILEFTPTTEPDSSVKLFAEMDFENGIDGVSTNGQGGSITAVKDDDGRGVLHFYADEKTAGGSFADVVCNALKAQDKFVVDFSVKVNSLTGRAGVGLFDTKNSYDAWALGYDLNAGGNIVSNNTGAVVGSVPTRKWTRISVAYNIPVGSADIYVNGVYTGSNTIRDDYYPVVFRIDLLNTEGSKHDVMIDWLRIYSGTKLQDASSCESSGDTDLSLDGASIMDPPDKLAAALNGKTVIMTANNTMYVNGEKISCSSEKMKPIVIDGNLMVSLDALSLWLNESVNYDAYGGIIQIGDTAQLKLGEKTYTLRGKTAELAVAPTAQNGVLYFPLRSVAEQILEKKVNWDNRGFAVISDNGIEVTSEYHYLDRYVTWQPIDLIYRYMCFDNPTGREMIEALEKNYPNKAHPRVYWKKEDADYILDHVDANSEWKKAYDDVIQSAQMYLEKDFSEQYGADDVTIKKQNSAILLHDSIRILSTAYLLTGESKYAEKGVEILKGYCSWKNMGLEVANLTTGHWASGIGIGFDTFYNYMNSTPEGRENIEYIKTAVRRTVYADHIHAYQTGESAATWMTQQDNFLGVVGGGIMTLCLSMADEEDMQEQSAYLLENSLRSLYIAAELYYPNGGYYEGVSYSKYMLDNLTQALDAMFNCCDTDYGMGNAKGFKNCGDFFTYAQSTCSSLGYHDGGPGYYETNVREFMGYRYDDAFEAQMAYEQKKLGKHSLDIKALYYYAKAVADRGEIPDTSSAPLDYYFYGTEGGSFRNSHEVSNQVFAGFHGGWTNIPHDMLDLGEFLFESDGVLWADDLGSDDYGLPSYFGRDGYKLYRKRPEGENCIVLNPKIDPDTYYGQNLGALAHLIDFDANKPRGAKAAYDLTEAYSRDASRYVRGYYFGDNRNTFTVQDELSLKGNTELYWFMHTRSRIEIISNTKARLTSSTGKTLTVDVYCSADGYTLSEMKAEPLPSSPKVDGQNPNNNYRKLAIHYPEVSGDVTISVKLSPDNDDYEYTGLQYVPISEWTIPDGEVPKNPTLSGIYADGILLDSFMPGISDYSIELPFGTEKVPQISAIADCGEISVIQAEDLYSKAKIILKVDGVKERLYTVRFDVSADRNIFVTDAIAANAKPDVGVSGELIKPKRAVAYTIPEMGNGPDKMLDDDFNTRATQSGEGMWFEFDFGEVIDISGVAVSYYDGNLRNFLYELWYSEDGINFKRVFNGESTGETNEYESLAIPGKVRYIRYVGNGNSGSPWNSLTEFRAYR